MIHPNPSASAGFLFDTGKFKVTTRKNKQWHLEELIGVIQQSRAGIPQEIYTEEELEAPSKADIMIYIKEEAELLKTVEPW